MAISGRRLLVTGASGFLGWNVCAEAVSRYEVTGTVREHDVALPVGTVSVRVDLAVPDQVEALLDRVRPDLLIHCAALAAAAACEADPAASRRANVDVTRTLAGQCAARGVRLVFCSTDLVFDGLHAPYAEADPTCPVNVYGRHKAEAEQCVLGAGPTGVVCRLPLLFGRGSAASGSILRGMVETLQAGGALRLFEDEFRTPTDGRSAARGLLAAALGEARLLHLGGPERLSRYDFGVRVVRAFGFSERQLLRCRQSSVPATAARPPDVALDSRLARRLGIVPAPLDEGLRRLAAEMPSSR